MEITHILDAPLPPIQPSTPSNAVYYDIGDGFGLLIPEGVSEDVKQSTTLELHAWRTAGLDFELLKSDTLDMSTGLTTRDSSNRGGIKREEPGSSTSSVMVPDGASTKTWEFVQWTPNSVTKVPNSLTKVPKVLEDLRSSTVAELKHNLECAGLDTEGSRQVVFVRLLLHEHGLDEKEYSRGCIKLLSRVTSTHSLRIRLKKLKVQDKSVLKEDLVAKVLLAEKDAGISPEHGVSESDW